MEIAARLHGTPGHRVPDERVVAGRIVEDRGLARAAAGIDAHVGHAAGMDLAIWSDKIQDAVPKRDILAVRTAMDDDLVVSTLTHELEHGVLGDGVRVGLRRLACQDDGHLDGRCVDGHREDVIAGGTGERTGCQREGGLARAETHHRIVV